MTERRARRKPGENRARLVQAGLHEFGLYGYQGASTARIAARAEVPQPHVYTNFTGKPELFLACLDEALDRVHTRDTALLAAAELLIYQALATALDPDHGAVIRHRLADVLTPAHRDQIVLAAASRLARGELLGE
ncbi:AcrR family transcriptional regulator [Leucobacter exalbidus]|uniref:AcrR family transcriptional regulator n=1 Tax=Leucobacter exalbidus TaxID=662960 RepID=A0A940PW80_9MICO|nr:AcrR family transcriptional regulator [Leucobacter exalbidus]